MKIKSFKILWAILTLQAILAHTSLADEGKENSPAEQNALKIITYNVLYGFNHHKSEQLGAEWINEQNPDVVALQELNKFTHKKLKQIAARWRHPHTVLLKEQGFPVGLTAKRPIKVLEKQLQGMHHGYLHCKSSAIHFFVVHLSPHSYKHRQAEAKILCAKIKPLLEQGEQVVVLGDFNATSPLDRQRLGRNKKLLAHLLAREKKYRHVHNLVDGNHDFSVMQTFLDVGLSDACSELIMNHPDTSGTFPSRLVAQTETEQSQLSRRIDFILLSHELARRCTSTSIYRGGILEQISDHYPVAATVRQNEEAHGKKSEKQRENPSDKN